MTIPNVTPFTGDLPDLDDPTTFNARMDAFATWFDSTVTEIAATVSGMNTALNDNGTVLDATADATQRVVNATEPTLSAGSATAYTLAAASTITAYADGQTFLVRVHVGSGSTPTLAIDGLSALPIQIRDDAGALAAIPDGLMRANELFLFTVVGSQTAFEITSQPIQEITDLIGLVPIVTKTASNSASLDFTEFDNTVYSGYVFESDAIVSSGSGFLGVRVSEDDASSYQSGATDYSFLQRYSDSLDTARTYSGDLTADLFALTSDLGTGTIGANFTLKVMSVQDGFRTRFDASTLYTNASSGDLSEAEAKGVRNGTQETDAIRFLLATGNITSGNITMYGIRKPA